MEWFYSCVEVYGIVYVEGLVVASISWVVVRTYISAVVIVEYIMNRTPKRWQCMELHLKKSS